MENSHSDPQLGNSLESNERMCEKNRAERRTVHQVLVNGATHIRHYIRTTIVGAVPIVMKGEESTWDNQVSVAFEIADDRGVAVVTVNKYERRCVRPEHVMSRSGATTNLHQSLFFAYVLKREPNLPKV
jgi:hypothetical protein